MTRQVVGNVSHLAKTAFGPRTLLWWGVLGFILIEGTVFLLVGGSYFFLMAHTKPWPPNGAPPDLFYGSLFTAAILASEVMNVLTERAAHQLKARRARAYLLVMIVFGAALCVIRGFEFTTLNVRWNENAYGSIAWAVLFLHTVHLVTDWVDSIVLAFFSYTHGVDKDRLSDIADNAMYWRFVVLAWLPLYGILYWCPRLLT